MLTDKNNNYLNLKSALVKKADTANLRNWETSKVSRDKLHLKACPINPCALNQCKGSVMNPSHMMVDSRTWERSIEETHRLAKDFIDQFYDSAKKTGSMAHIDRLNEVKKSIEATGTYDLTYPELTFGAKTAWRNAPRCIGRIQWNNLNVYDCRHMTTTAEMFEAICYHLKQGTNNGNIRSCITVFKPRSDTKRDFRVWNSQLVRYAGYEQEDGTVIGDPINVEFTQICEYLGWKGKGGRFDLLPMVLQANGEDPDWYELPEDLILEVKLRHPEFDWFEDLGLKWYALPAVSNMLLDIGGVQFAACPFNGWFMGTEIARDLCDTSRYNMLQPIAKKMDLNTNVTSSLWKDKAIVEMNIAIIHSFQFRRAGFVQQVSESELIVRGVVVSSTERVWMMTDKVTLMDHHAATESFMKHYQNEMKLRKGCPGDWVWLVPPISGSTTPIFHQEILNYMLNPNCYYQVDAWKCHTWKNPRMLEIMGRKRKCMKLRTLAQAIRGMTSLMGKALSKRTKVTILYATETGRSKTYAYLLRNLFNFAFKVKVVAMCDYDIRDLELESLVLVVTSTFGNGDPPENGEKFAHQLHEMSQNEQYAVSKQKLMVKDVLEQRQMTEQQTFNLIELNPKKNFFYENDVILAKLKFSVFGLGSTAYPNFCAFAHEIDTKLGEMGAERLLQIGEGDELAGQKESFKDWAKNVFTMACETFCIKNINLKDAVQSLGLIAYDRKNFRVAVQKSGKKIENKLRNLEKLHHKKLHCCKLTERIDLHPRSIDRATILVKLQKDNPSQLQFEPGDHIGIFPENEPELVTKLLKRIQDVPEHTALVQLETRKQKEWTHCDRLPKCSVWNAFSTYLDITTPPTPQLLKLLAECATSEEDKSRLGLLSKSNECYYAWKNTHLANMVEVLDEFSSIRVELSLLLSQLPLLQCRYYSISSSPDVYRDQIHCTLGVVTYRTHGGKGHLHRGVCSTFLDNIEENKEVPCFIRQAPLFHLPAEVSTPCILVGPGTGIAPFRSFWQQRIHTIQKQENSESSMALFFGCRKPCDQLYEKELEEAVDVGAFSHAFTAYSRSPDVPKTYVQDIMRNKAGEYLCDSLINQQGHFYVCGDVNMAADVAKALLKIFIENGKMTEAEAKAETKKMKTEKRYHEDIFGVNMVKGENRSFIERR